MGGQLTKILMCEPQFYDVIYQINPWMMPSGLVDLTKAIAQWQVLHATVLQLGARVELISAEPKWPDMVFTANAGMVFDDKRVFLSQFRYPERQGERACFAAWFRAHGFTIYGDDAQYYQGSGDHRAYHGPNFEGAGDALFFADYLFAAYGFRSDKAAYDVIAPLVRQKMMVCELIDPYFYHLDTCFCPLNDEFILWWPGAFSVASRSQMQVVNATFLAVPEVEAKRFACNSIVIGNNIILPDGCPETERLLRDHGFVTHAVAMSEYIKSGGACKCLSLVVAD